ncbi:unnamed protein product [Protopolystoma xenopodis]|uniref:Uncharacterized protein n=1 Tax=Protopolystoma xenopodis TaxID=117903 RepID=A0A3S5B792_9PLAT|nr:unnamed protein product [Protopolystoma xenopodis]
MQLRSLLSQRVTSLTSAIDAVSQNFWPLISQLQSDLASTRRGLTQVAVGISPTHVNCGRLDPLDTATYTQLNLDLDKLAGEIDRVATGLEECRLQGDRAVELIVEGIRGQGLSDSKRSSCRVRREEAAMQEEVQQVVRECWFDLDFATWSERQGDLVKRT